MHKTWVTGACGFKSRRPYHIKMKKRIHINQHKIRSNSKTGNREDVITVKTYKSNDYCYEAQIDGPCKVVYSPDKPLSCGAKVWIETESDVICLSREQINKLKENKC